MKKARGKPVSRFFDPPKKPKEEKIKEVLSEAAQKDRANKEIKALHNQFRGKRLIDLLPVIKRRCSRYVVEIAVERIERKKDELNPTDRIYFEGFKQELEQNGVS